MSVDAAAIIVAITTAAGVIVQGADVAQPVKDQASESVQAAQQASPGVQQQVDDGLAMLPERAQQQAQQMLTGAAGAVKNATDPYMPPPPPVPAAPPAALPSIPNAPVVPGTSSGTSSGSAGAASGVALPSLPTLPGGLPGLIPSIPAGFPGVSLAPIGAIAVFAPWIRKAGSLCDAIKPPTLAALYSVESGFHYGAAAPVSPAGARGPGQIMPDVWEKYGQDADGDGKADINGVADSMMASGHKMCDDFAQVEAWKKEGTVKGDSVGLTLAAYSAGADAIRLAGGIPPAAPGDVHALAPNVVRIRSLEDSFTRMLSPFFYGVDPGTASRIVDVALKYIGLPYVWGGGDINGPSMGGFDCSGLTSFAIHAATGLVLPRTSESQWQKGVELPMDQAKPGDLLFGNWGPNGPGHVAIYVGNGQMLHAPDTGDIVRIGPVFAGMKARRMVDGA